MSEIAITVIQIILYTIGLAIDEVNRVKDNLDDYSVSLEG